jgi:hypothetical protein
MALSIYTTLNLKNISLKTELDDYFEKMDKKISSGEIAYSDFNNYYKKYLETVLKNVQKFDYVTNGTKILDAKVEANEEEKLVLRNQKLELGKFIAGYKTTTGLKPSEIYIAIKSISDYVNAPKMYSNQTAPVVLQKVANR